MGVYSGTKGLHFEPQTPVLVHVHPMTGVEARVVCLLLCCCTLLLLDVQIPVKVPWLATRRN